MTTVYRTAGAWGAGSGADLTPAQVDTNFYDKETRITAIEVAGVAIGVDSITISGDQLTFTMSDSSTQVVTIPTAQWNFTGEWVSGIPYAVNDVVTNFGNVYVVIFAHTSAGTFDAGANDGGGHNYYGLVLAYPSIPGREISDSTYTTTIDDTNFYLRFTNASGCAVTIDPAVDYPPWTEMHFRDDSSGGVLTVDTATPGTINPVTGYLNQAAARGGTITVKQVGVTKAWDIMGLLAIDVTA